MTLLASLRALPVRRTILVGGALLSGVVLGAGGLAVAAGGPMMGAFHGGDGHRLERLQHVLASTLDSVGATSAQEGRIHDIAAATFTELDRDPGARQALRSQVIALLRAPTLDRAAVEALRAAQIVKFDTMSKTVVAAALDAADQLTPDQRAKLADRAEAMMQRHATSERWGGPHGPGMDDHGPMRGGMGHGPDEEHGGPDGGLDGGPDKG